MSASFLSCNIQEYDCDLELNAQAWSDNCVWAHSAPAQRVLGGVQSGENMWYTTALNFDKVTELSRSVGLFIGFSTQNVQWDK